RHGADADRARLHRPGLLHAAPPPGEGLGYRVEARKCRSGRRPLVKYRRLGKSGPQVSAVSQGRGATPVKFGEPLEADFNAAIRRALDLGVNFFDSSDAYWGTRHE